MMVNTGLIGVADLWSVPLEQLELAATLGEPAVERHGLDRVKCQMSIASSCSATI
jgi:hypothetical protein